MLVELVSQHYYGDDKKWNFLAITEGTKVLVRLSYFWKSGYKMLLHGGEKYNDETHSDSLASQHQTILKPDGHHGSDYMRNNHGPNPWYLEGRALSALSSFEEKARTGSDPMWLRRVHHQQATLEHTGFFHLLRPVDGGNEQKFHLSAPEKDEVKQQKLLFVLYLIRDPFFSKYTRQRLESTEKILEPLPILGFLAAKIVQLIIGAQIRYTYMSGS